jgi:hypothetical protein
VGREWEREQRKGQKGISKGSKKQGDCAIYISQPVYVYINAIVDVDNNLL